MSARRRLSANAYMRKLDGEAIVKRFPQAFIEDPDLTPEIFYEILLAAKFDVKEAQLKVIELVRKPGKFIIPANLLDPDLSQPSDRPSYLQQESQDKFHVTRSSRDYAFPLRSTTPPIPIGSQVFTPPRLKRRASLIETNVGIIEIDRLLKRSKSGVKPIPISFASVVESASSTTILASTKADISSFASVVEIPKSTNKPASKKSIRYGFIPDNETNEAEQPIRSAERPARIAQSLSSDASFYTAESPSKAISAEAVSPIVKKPLVIDLTLEEDNDHISADLAYSKPACITPKLVKLQGFKTPDWANESENEVPSEHEELRDIEPSTPKSSGRKGKRSGANSNVKGLQQLKRKLNKTIDSDTESPNEVPSENEELLGVDPEDWEPFRTRKSTGRKGKRSGANQNEKVLQHREQSVATPWLFKLARPFYPNKVDLLKGYPYEEGPKDLPDLDKNKRIVRRIIREREQEMRGFAEDIRFNRWAGNDVAQYGYASVTIDGITYLPGDCVMIYSGAEDQFQVKQGCKKGGRKKGRSNAAEEEDDTFDKKDPWYGRIKYFHKDEYGKDMAHIQWLLHASETAQGELACPFELFLISDCTDEEVSCFARKIVVTDVKRKSDGAVGIIEDKFILAKEYFYRFHYDRITRAFTEAASYELHDYKAGAGPCETCAKLNTAAKETGFVKILGKARTMGSEIKIKSFRLRGIDYCLYDFVYIFEDEKKIYKIGQITEISGKLASWNKETALIREKKLLIDVDFYGRVDDLISTSWFEEITEGKVPKVRDERRLYYTEINCPRDRDRILLDQLDGKCFVRHRDDIEDLDSYKDKDDRFWVDQQVSVKVDPLGYIGESDLIPLGQKEMRYSNQSTIEAETKENRDENFKNNGKKLVAMDLFSGAGGLTVGMKLSDVVETRHAVEFSEAACRTHKKNFPECMMHNADINLMLERAIDRDRGQKLKPLYDHHDDTVEDLPTRGSIDFIYGGCPCPGYSRANRYPQEEDIKNSLLIVLLSYVDYYRPKYFLLENVRDLLVHRLGAIRYKGKLEGGIESGTMKFIFRALTSLGYQCHYALLQAAEYGVPSARQRVFFWASLPGYPLPQFPQSQNLQNTLRIARNDDATWYRNRRSAPHRKCTIGDAITDLPKFDWSHPLRADDSTITEDRTRRWSKEGINQYEVVEDAVGMKCQSYAIQPLSEFQRKMRIGVGMDDLLNHVTHGWGDKMTILICEIPMRPGADHRDVANELKSRFLWHPDSRAKGNNFYPGRCGRLDMKDGFGTCITDIYPISINGKVVHPTQHRVISIVEYARLMSFPDSFGFELDGSRVKDVIRQIGNAVPPFLAKAVGSGLTESMYRKFEEDQERVLTPDSPINRGVKAEQSTNTKHASRKQNSFKGGDSANIVIYLD